MIALVTLSDAKLHLNVVGTEKDYEIGQKIDMASDIVLDYIKVKTIPDEWTINTSPETFEIPALIQAATLLVLGELFLARESSGANVLSDYVKGLLRRFRDPAYA